MTDHARRVTDRIIQGDVQTRIGWIPDRSADCIITSPPYWGLRDYQTAGQFGLEPTLAEYMKNLLGVMSECWRILKPTGSLWVNLGDPYGKKGRGSSVRPKSLSGIPERFAVAMLDAEQKWILRNKLIMQKANPMPASVRDRLAATYEPVYFFVKS